MLLMTYFSENAEISDYECGSVKTDLSNVVITKKSVYCLLQLHAVKAVVLRQDLSSLKILM